MTNSTLPTGHHAPALQPIPRPRTRPTVLPYTQVPGVLEAIRRSDAQPSHRYALEFLILTASLPGEVLDARWEDIDLETGQWRVSQWEHRWTATHRPLSSHAHRVLTMARELSTGNGFVFPGRSNRALSRQSLSTLLHGLGISATPKSFRTSYAQWCADTGVPEWVFHRCLGHLVPSIGFQRPRPSQPVHEAMQGWGDYLMSAPAVP